ncbi:MAG TPA: N-6 DNA methylase, partial [Gemmatales bacterium]|nr:N-6 DNA methylase [Gemmatales bacterium]
MLPIFDHALPELRRYKPGDRAARIVEVLMDVAALGRGQINRRVVIAKLVRAGAPRRQARELLDEISGQLPNLSALLPEALTGLYAEFLDTDPSQRQRRGSLRRSQGCFYTPPELIERVLDLAWQPLLEDGLRDLHATSALGRLRVADLACGTGHFLLAAARRMSTSLHLARESEPLSARPQSLLEQQALSANVFGMDIDSRAIDLGLRAMALESGRYDVRPGAQPLVVGNAQFDCLPEPFDAVVGNPPWVSYSGRQRVAISARDRANLLRRYPALARWPALHSALLLRALEAVRPGGRVGLVLPRQMAELRSYASVRAAATTQAELVAAEDMGEAAFAGVTQPIGVFAFVRKDLPGSGSPAPWPLARAEARPLGMPLLSTGECENAARSEEDRSWAQELAVQLADWPRFPSGTFSDLGVHTGNAGRLLVVPDNPGSQAVPIRVGRDLVPYGCGPARHWLRLDVPAENGRYFRLGSARRFRTVPILLRQTASRPLAARHRGRGHFRNSLLACWGVEAVPDAVVVAILNSALMAVL